MKYVIGVGLLMELAAMGVYVLGYLNAAVALAFLAFIAIVMWAIHWLVSDPEVLAKRD